MSESIEIADGYSFDGVPADAMGPVKALCKSQDFKSGETVFDEDEPAQDVFLLESGKIELTFSLPQKGRETQIRITEIHPGEVFGWSGLGVSESWTARANVVYDSKIIRIPGAELKKLMDADPRLGYPVMEQMLKLLVSRLKDTRHQLRWLLGSVP
jgi:toluene monooxygenase system ferredoxin subunit